MQKFQTGVDRIAIESPWGSKLTSVAEFGVIAGDELTWYLVNKIQFADTLNTSTIAYQDGISVISMGNKRSAANSEYWDEISWIHDEESYFRASIGRSDRLFGNWGSEFEYHYNQLGQEYTGKYADNANKLSYQRQWLTLDARHYFYMNMLNTMTANSVISTPLIWNINDGSLRYGLKADYYWSDDSGFSITGLWSTGDEGDEFAEVPATVKAEVLLRF